MSFNEQLTKLRKRNNITQIELANLMNVKQYVISSWETGDYSRFFEPLILF